MVGTSKDPARSSSKGLLDPDSPKCNSHSIAPLVPQDN